MSNQTKLFKISFEKALKACGPGESVLEVLDVLMDEGVIKSFEVTLEIKVDRDQSTAIENFFLLKDFDKQIAVKVKK